MSTVTAGNKIELPEALESKVREVNKWLTKADEKIESKKQEILDISQKASMANSVFVELEKRVKDLESKKDVLVVDSEKLSGDISKDQGRFNQLNKDILELEDQKKLLFDEIEVDREDFEEKRKSLDLERREFSKYILLVEAKEKRLESILDRFKVAIKGDISLDALR